MHNHPIFYFLRLVLVSQTMPTFEGVSENGGTPQWMIYKGKSYEPMDDSGVPLFSDTPISLSNSEQNHFDVCIRPSVRRRHLGRGRGGRFKPWGWIWMVSNMANEDNINDNL